MVNAAVGGGGAEYRRNRRLEDLKGGARGGVSLCRGEGLGVEHLRGRGEESTEYRIKRRCIIPL